MRLAARTLAGCASLLLFGAALAAILHAPALAAPPPCANLEITHFAISPSQLYAGSPASVQIEVRNSGSCAAAPVLAQFKLSQHSAPAVAETTVPGLKPGESQSLTLAYDFPKAGNFQTEVVIDPAHEVSQPSYLKDVAIKSITVLAPAPDLVIKSVAVTSNDPTKAVVQKRPALATVVVENAGNAPAASYYVQWTPAALSKALTRSEPAGLQPGHSETVSLEYTYASKGAVTASFAINASGKATKDAYTVEAAVPNLRIEKVTPHPEFAGLASTVEVTIENDGNAAAGPFLVEWAPGKGQSAQTEEVHELAEGAITTLTFSKVFQPAGTYEGTVTLDPTHLVTELFSTEKTAATLLVVPEPTVDLTVTETVVSTPVIESEPTTVDVTVANLGNTRSPSFVTAWNPDSLGASGSGVQTLAKETGPLGPGEVRTIEFHFAYAKPGLYRSVSEVNPGHTITESNYANNVMLKEVRVEPVGIELEFLPPPPQEGIHIASPEFNGSRLFVHEDGTASLTVINKGPIATGAFEVQFQQESVAATIPGSREGFKQGKFIPGLNPDEQRELTFRVDYAKPGHYLAKAVIDPQGFIEKTIPEDVDTREVVVEGKSATITVRAKELDIKWRPGNTPTPTTGLPKPLKGNFTVSKPHFEKWEAYLFVYAPGQKCKIQSSNISGETITKTVQNLAPEEGGGGFCPREVEWQPKEPEEGPGRQTGGALHAKVELHEEQPLYAATQATSVYERVLTASVRVCFLFVCKTYKVAEVPLWEFASPGVASLHESRSEYVDLNAAAKTLEVKGVGCHDDTSNEEPPEGPPHDFEGGNCFNTLYELSGSHVGPAAIRGGTDDAARPASASLAEGEGEEGEEGSEAEEREAEEREAAEREALENEFTEQESEAVRVAEEEAAEAEAAERAGAATAIEGGTKALEEVDRHLESESKATARRAVEEALIEAERLEGGGAEAAALHPTPAAAPRTVR